MLEVEAALDVAFEEVLDVLDVDSSDVPKVKGSLLSDVVDTLNVNGSLLSADNVVRAAAGTSLL